MLPRFFYQAPESLAEAVGLLQRRGSEVRIVAGGTVLLVALERRRDEAGCLLDLQRIAGLRRITARGAELEIGAMVTLAELGRAAPVRARYPVLAETVRQMATPQVRNLGTVGGNLCAALPMADLAVVLLTLDATLRLTGPEGERQVALAAFLAAAEQRFAPGELLRSIVLPEPAGRAAYQRFSVRQAADVPLANVAVRLVGAAGRISDVRVAVGDHAQRPARLPAVETALQGRPFDRDALDLAAQAVSAACAPQGDFRGSAWYRRQLNGVLARRALAQTMGT